MSRNSEKATLTANGELGTLAPPPAAGVEREGVERKAQEGKDAPRSTLHAPRLSSLLSAPERLRLPARRRQRRRGLLLLLVLLAVAAAGAGLWAWRGRTWWRQWARERVAATAPATYQVSRGDLPIVVAEGGSLEALRSEIIKSEVEGKSTIISLVPEGTLITEEDAKKGKILVELDSADLREKLTAQEITHATAKAAYTEAKEGLDIQKSQAESDIKEAELNVKLGRMELELYVGRDLAGDALEGRVDLLKLAEQLYQKAGERRQVIEGVVTRALAEVDRSLKEAAAEPKEPAPPSGLPAQTPDAAPSPSGSNGDPELTAAEPVAAARFGGTALQKKRELEADIGLAHEEFKRGAEKLIWTAKLERKGYVSHSELETDRLALKRGLVTLQQALSARELFLRYQFPKEAEKLLSGYVEAGRELERVKAKSRSVLAQAEAKLKSTEATFGLQESKLAKLRRQVAACTIRATQPGLVVYGSAGDSWRSMNQPIEVGATVIERQEIIRLPDVSALAAEVRVHESVVSKVRPGLEARVHVDAFPNLVLRGKVSKVGILASSQSRWMNPDLKQYDTQVILDETPPRLKPGMSTKVEIVVTLLKDVILIPAQAVAMREGKTVVYVLDQGAETPRDVTVGESNQEYVEVRAGLEEGEIILLRAPQVVTVREERDKRDADKKRDGDQARRDEERAKERDGKNGPPGGPGASPAPSAGEGAPRPAPGARPPRPRGESRKR